MCLATELALECVDRDTSVLPFPLQDTKGDQAAGQVMPLRPLGTRLTAIEPELIFTDADDFLDLSTHLIESADLRGRQRQAVGGKVFGAVSNDQHFQASTQPAALRPIGVAPIGSERLAIEAAILLETTDEIPSIVTNALQQGFRGIPGVKEDILWATVQAVAGIAEELQGQRLLGGATFAPELHAQRNPGPAIGPYQQHEGEAIHGSPLLTGIHPRQALDRRGKRLRNDCVIDDEIPPLPDKECAEGQLQECLPRPICPQQSRQAVV
jgi:hypothetical protein